MPYYPSNLHVALVDSAALASKIEQELIAHGGEVTPELEALLEFKSYDDLELKDCIDYHLMASDRLSKSIEYFEEQINALKKVQDALTKAQSRMEANLTAQMHALNLERLDGLYYKVSFRSTPPAVDILDETAVSPEFKQIKITETIKKKEISEFLKKGGQLEWARLTQSKVLKIERQKALLGGSDDE